MENINIGLLLSGGFGKGAYQAGALKVITQRIPFDSVKCISATSIGCLNAYAYATGNNEYSEYAWNAINETSDSILLTDLYKNGYLDSVVDNLGKMSTLIDFYVSVLKMGHKNRSVNYINMRDLSDQNLRRDYLRASIAVPIMSKSVKIDGCRYYDGGCVDNNPIEPLLNKNLDIIIFLGFDQSVQFDADESLKRKIIRICFDDGSRIKKEMHFTDESVRSMISYGEEYTGAVLDFIFNQEKLSLTKIQKRIEVLNLLQTGRRNKKRITVANFLTELNKITKRMCKQADT